MHNANLWKRIGGAVGLKFVLLVAIAQAAIKLIPYDGYFSFPDILDRYQLPLRLQSLANLDGVHYLRIASSGYYDNGQAFFPVYPLLMKVLGWLVLNQHVIAGLVISQLAFAGGLYLLYKTLHPFLKKQTWWVVVFLLAYPTAFFFQSVYTEALFFFEVAATFYFISRKQFAVAAAIAAVASATRIQGVFLCIPFLVLFWQQKQGKYLGYAAISVLGLLAYMGYLWLSVGDPLAFFHAQSAFGAGRSTHIVTLPQVYVRYAKILFLSQHNFGYWLAVLECVSFSIACAASLWECLRRWKTKEWLLVSLALFSLANIVLPTVTGTFLSEQRFALLALSQFVFLATIPRTWIKVLLATVFILLQIILFSFFFQGKFVG